MTKDYLGLGKRPEGINLDIRLPKDPYGFETFEKNRHREVRQAVKGIKTIKREAKEFHQDFSGGGWIGEYIKRKQQQHKAEKQTKNVRVFGQNIRNKRNE